MRKIKKMLGFLLLCMIVGIGSPVIPEKVNNVVEVQAATKVATPKLVSVKPSGTTKAVIRWNPVKGVSGYRIYRSTDGKKWKALKTISGASKKSYTDSKLKTGTRYYYTVRAYKKTKGKTVWGGYNKKGLNTIAGLNTLKLNKSSLSLYEGKSYTLKINGTKIKPTWKSNNTNVATVNKNGKVVAKKKGSATITATLGGRKINCKVTVKAEKILSVSATSVSLENNQSRNIKITFNKSGETLYYEIEDENIVECTWGEWNGNTCELTIKALRGGQTKVFVSNSYNKEKIVISISVKMNTLENNFYKISSVITNKGYLNSNGEKCISFKDDDLLVEYEISYCDFSNCLTFNMTHGTGIANQFVTMYINYSDILSKQYMGYVSVYYFDNSVDVSAFTEINAIRYNDSSTPHFTLDMEQSHGCTEASVQKLCVSGLKAGMAGWSILLNYIGYEFSDLGFSLYN